MGEADRASGAINHQSVQAQVHGVLAHIFITIWHAPFPMQHWKDGAKMADGFGLSYRLDGVLHRIRKIVCVCLTYSPLRARTTFHKNVLIQHAIRPR